MIMTRTSIDHQYCGKRIAKGSSPHGTIVGEWKPLVKLPLKYDNSTENYKFKFAEQA